jgi:hypothetical protein
MVTLCQVNNHPRGKRLLVARCWLLVGKHGRRARGAGAMERAARGFRKGAASAAPLHLSETFPKAPEAPMGVPSAAKAGVEERRLAAWLKPRPFKATDTKIPWHRVPDVMGFTLSRDQEKWSWGDLG